MMIRVLLHPDSARPITGTTTYSVIFARSLDTGVVCTASIFKGIIPAVSITVSTRLKYDLINNRNSISVFVVWHSVSFLFVKDLQQNILHFILLLKYKIFENMSNTMLQWYIQQLCIEK
jgi:hypothetical protein